MLTEILYFVWKIRIDIFVVLDLMKELDHELVAIGQNHIQHL